MTGKQALKAAKKLGCKATRQKGSHVRVECPCGKHPTTVVVKQGEDLGPGLLRSIERDLEPCLGEGWLRG